MRGGCVRQLHARELPPRHARPARLRRRVPDRRRRRGHLHGRGPGLRSGRRRDRWLPVRRAGRRAGDRRRAGTPEDRRHAVHRAGDRLGRQELRAGRAQRSWTGSIRSIRERPRDRPLARALRGVLRRRLRERGRRLRHEHDRPGGHVSRGGPGRRRSLMARLVAVVPGPVGAHGRRRRLRRVPARAGARSKARSSTGSRRHRS